MLRVGNFLFPKVFLTIASRLSSHPLAGIPNITLKFRAADSDQLVHLVYTYITTQISPLCFHHSLTHFWYEVESSHRNHNFYMSYLPF